MTLDIASIAAGGDGVARHDGLVVFVPRTAPGDRIMARVTPHGRMGRGLLETVEQPSADRVTPECPHYERDRCGGCQLQHMSLASQHSAKREIIRDSMKRIGKRDVALPELRSGASPWRYRRKLTLALHRSVGGAEGWRAGLHAYDDPDHVFALDDCHIADPRLMNIWREILNAAPLLPDVLRLRGSVRLLGDDAAFVLEGGAHWPSHADFFAQVPHVAALWWVNDDGARRLLDDRRTHAEPGASFVQVNPAVAMALQALVLERAASYAPARVVDAYAGAGDTAHALAQRGIAVTAIELDDEASLYSSTRLPTGSLAVQARVEDALEAALPADVVILNPPRAGVDARVTALLAAAVHRPSSPRAIIYVSCDPATLARDVGRLPGWRVAALTAFDMFPQTAHIETVCELVPELVPEGAP
jgi:23S rRNA (uracil1939-C5)-methyltransferase